MSATAEFNASQVEAIAVGGLSDGEFARRIAAGDEPAFEGLMRKHNRRLYRVARAVLRNDADAEDALQLAYLHAYQAIGDYRGESTLATWLTRIVVNEALMRARKRNRESVVIALESMAGESDMAMIENIASPTELPDSAAIRGETRALIERRIDALPEIFRTVFVLRALEELSVEETAASLDIPEATVRTRFFRARSLLRDALARDIDVATADAFAFDGARCDRIVTSVLQRLRSPNTT
ncbi:MAG TPA: RNA polymerase sigma factor [Burkholderiales bacterium]